MARKWKIQALALVERRPNPGREEFLATLAADCEPDIAEFVWTIFTEEYSHWSVELTPHPDDDYLEDMPIDPENQTDWFGDFCKAFAVSYDDFPNWPRDAATTVRNYARWLSDGRRLLARSAA